MQQVAGGAEGHGKMTVRPSSSKMRVVSIGCVMTGPLLSYGCRVDTPSCLLIGISALHHEELVAHPGVWLPSHWPSVPALRRWETRLRCSGYVAALQRWLLALRFALPHRYAYYGSTIILVSRGTE